MSLKSQQSEQKYEDKNDEEHKLSSGMEPNLKPEELPNKDVDAMVDEVRRRKREEESETSANVEVPVRPRKSFATLLKDIFITFFLILLTLSILLRLFSFSLRILGIKY